MVCPLLLARGWCVGAPNRDPTASCNRTQAGSGGTGPYCAWVTFARAWAKVGADLRVPAPGQAKKIAVLGSLDHVTGELIMDTTALRHVNVPKC
jgi:hypothetical protein